MRFKILLLALGTLLASALTVVVVQAGGGTGGPSVSEIRLDPGRSPPGPRGQTGPGPAAGEPTEDRRPSQPPGAPGGDGQVDGPPVEEDPMVVYPEAIPLRPAGGDDTEDEEEDDEDDRGDDGSDDGTDESERGEADDDDGDEVDD